jgi:hypothetical protein
MAALSAALKNQKEDSVKKGRKKLALNRETLLSLDRLHLPEVAGGITAVCTTYTNCCSGQATCATCGATCTSKLC